jgi:hypothetical protein
VKPTPGKKSSRPPEDDDDAPDSPPRKKGSPVAMILGIVGGVFLLLCLGCVGVLGYGVYAGVGFVNDFMAMVGAGPATSTKPGDSGNGQPTLPIDLFKPPAKITTLAEAVDAIKSTDKERQRSGAD